MIYRMNAEVRIVSEHERTDIERRARLGGYPIAVEVHEGIERLKRKLLVKLGQAEALRRIVHSAYVLDGAEHLDLPVGSAVRLEPFEYLGSVVEHGACGIEAEISVGYDARIVPAVLLIIVHDKHMIAENMSEAEILLIRLFLRRLSFRDSYIHDKILTFR